VVLLEKVGAQRLGDPRTVGRGSTVTRPPIPQRRPAVRRRNGRVTSEVRGWSPPWLSWRA